MREGSQGSPGRVGRVVWGWGAVMIFDTALRAVAEGSILESVSILIFQEDGFSKQVCGVLV